MRRAGQRYLLLLCCLQLPAAGARLSFLASTPWMRSQQVEDSPSLYQWQICQRRSVLLRIWSGYLYWFQLFHPMLVATHRWLAERAEPLEQVEFAELERCSVQIEPASLTSSRSPGLSRSLPSYVEMTSDPPKGEMRRRSLVGAPDRRIQNSQKPDPVRRSLAFGKLTW